MAGMAVPASRREAGVTPLVEAGEATRFKPGQSGNPSGRPKGIASTVRKQCGGSPDELVDRLRAVARGDAVDESGTRPKPARPADQIRAVEALLAYGWGKPASFAAIEGADPLELDELSREISAIADELRARRDAA